MAKWRCLHKSISLSEALKGLSAHDCLLYTWGFAHTDNWGLLRRSHVKRAVFPDRSTGRQVELAIERLITCGKVCEQENNGQVWLHWCWFDDYQGECIRKRSGQPACDVQCPNELRGKSRNGAELPEVSALHLHYNTVQDKTVVSS